MSGNGQQASNWWIGLVCAKKNALGQLQLSLPIETQIFIYLMYIYMYFNDICHKQGNSHVSHNQNQANITIMRKKTSLTKLS